MTSAAVRQTKSVVWNVEEIRWIAIATTVAGLLVMGAARLAAATRLRRHRNLIAEALERMCALVSEQSTKPRLRGLGRKVVELLVRQDSAALALRSADSPAAEGPKDLALLIAADAATTTVEPMCPDQPDDDSVWEEDGVAPSVSEHPRLREIAEQMGRSSIRLITMGRLVLNAGEQFGLPEEDAKQRLMAVLERVRLAVRDAERLAEEGSPLAALTALTSLDIPVPESGFPGQAVADELRTQVNALARLGIRHHTALSDYQAAETQEGERR
jgi:hypothetical protein